MLSNLSFRTHESRGLASIVATIRVLKQQYGDLAVNLATPMLKTGKVRRHQDDHMHYEDLNRMSQFNEAYSDERHRRHTRSSILWGISLIHTTGIPASTF